MSLCIAVDGVMQAASMVESVISLWSMLFHGIGSEPRVMTNPVQEHKVAGSSASLALQWPAKFASTQQSKERLPLGLMIKQSLRTPFG